MTNGPVSRRTALIVDDDPVLLGLLAELIEDAGFATTRCEVGEPALVALTERQFDLLLIDQWLPDMNGLHLCAAARQRYGESAVVMMITADPRIERHVTALTTCVDDVVCKPFNIDVLVARIEAKLRQSARVAA